MAGAPFRRERRHLAVARVSDERRPLILLLRIVLSLPDRIVVVDVGARLRVQSIDASLHPRDSLFGGEELFAGELGRPLERRVCVVGPVALEVRLTVHGQRRYPWPPGL